MWKLVALLVLAGAVLFVCATLYRRNCDRREAAFQSRVEQVRHDAKERLKIGTKKDDIVRFFSENGFRKPYFSESRATGRILTTRGCRSLGCGIGPEGGEIKVTVTVDQQGTVQGSPVVDERFMGDCI
jgi:hypothetical protein